MSQLLILLIFGIPPVANITTSQPPTPVVLPAFKFVLSGTVYDNGSAIQASDIGEGPSCLKCTTNNTNCCGTRPNRAGEFFKPDGTRVGIEVAGESVYRNRGDQHVCLNRRGEESIDLGIYCCEIPDSSGVSQNLCITVN